LFVSKKVRLAEVEGKKDQIDKQKAEISERVERVDADETVFIDPKQGETTYICKECGFEAKSQLGLTSHMRKHQ
jgi:hypothetical protein